MLCISSMSWYLDEVIFSGSLPFSGVALLNWFTKSSKFEEGFNNNELSWSFSRSYMLQVYTIEGWKTSLTKNHMIFYNCQPFFSFFL